MQVCALRCIQSLLVPFLARGLRHELHQLVVAILRGMLPKISPGRFQCFVPPAESGQQLALEAVEVVGGRGADMTLPVDGNPALDPRQRLIRLTCGEQCAESQLRKMLRLCSSRYLLDGLQNLFRRVYGTTGVIDKLHAALSSGGALHLAYH